MKTPILAAALAAALVTAATATAQIHRPMTVNVPFSFTAAKTSFPAGKCELRPTSHQHMLTLRCEGEPGGIFLTGHGAYRTPARTESVLIFNRYGSRYFLSQVWAAGSSDGVELSKSKVERELASAKRNSGQVVLALR